ncbi:hypothetical protein PCAR4_60191 [Paraburkholderia caribensis]|nr:hypothetical protein PCAR4_60191 [Paraburkholderia caribensis]
MRRKLYGSASRFERSARISVECRSERRLQAILRMAVGSPVRSGLKGWSVTVTGPGSDERLSQVTSVSAIEAVQLVKLLGFRQRRAAGKKRPSIRAQESKHFC